MRTYTLRMPSQKPVLCIVGLGYVGLPLAHAFAAKGYVTIGYDINAGRIAELMDGIDRTGELTTEQLASVQWNLSSDPAVIAAADIIIVALPTPIDAQNKPDITILKKGTEIVGSYMKQGAIVVFESTVYPGTTEEICGRILEESSGMQCGQDFTLGYSPERINPGDKEHTVTKILKIVSGQDERTLQVLCDLYGDIIEAGVHRASSIRIAEMAKAIENAQRDLNIAFINEIAMLCNAIGISTKEVLAAAATKWNFLPFEPGLVGGHCIGVDPYYLVEKARQLNMDTQVIVAGRSVNDGMGAFVAGQIHTALSREPSRILVLGLTFKENVPDTRNSKSGDVIRALIAHGHTVEAHDPLVPDEAPRNGFAQGALEEGLYDAVCLLVPHRQYKDMGALRCSRLAKEGGVFYDLKSVFDPAIIAQQGRRPVSL